MTLPAWSTGTCLSEYVPLVARFLGDFCHSERIRRSVFSSLVKLLGSRLEIDHVHYLRGRFMRRSSATNPPSIVILHVDLPLEFPAQPPRLGISCLTWLDQTTNRPFSREVPHSWATADLASLDSLATAIAQPLLAAVDSFVRKASNGSRGTVYFLQRPEQSAAAAARADATMSSDDHRRLSDSGSKKKEKSKESSSARRNRRRRRRKHATSRRS
jgi:hypothetical protein